MIGSNFPCRSMYSRWACTQSASRPPPEILTGTSLAPRPEEPMRSVHPAADAHGQAFRPKLPGLMPRARLAVSGRADKESAQRGSFEA